MQSLNNTRDFTYSNNNTFALMTYLPDRHASLEGMHRSVTNFVHNRMFFVQFVTYSLVVTLVCAGVLMAIQADDSVGFLDAWFVAVSCFTLTGMTTIDYTRWHLGALCIMLVTIELGNLILCSAVPSMLRLRKLLGKQTTQADLTSEQLGVIRMHINVHKTILWCCIAYVTLMHFFGFLLLLQQGSAWWSLFYTISSFNAVGFELGTGAFKDPDLAGNGYLLFILVFLMHMGNTLYPALQRVFATAIQRFLGWLDRSEEPHWYFFYMSVREFEQGLVELLAHPRQYYTHIFSTKHTMYLLLMWTVLTAVDMATLFIHMGDEAFPVQSMKFLEGVFQVVSLRTAGFELLFMDRVKEAHLLYWVMSMYMATYPFIITERNSRIRDTPIVVEESGVKSSIYNIKRAAKGTIAREIGWLYLAILAISFLENNYKGDASNSLIQLIFEVVSAYSNVGLSVESAENPKVSYCGVFKSDLSKLIIMLLMYCGKFRNLPWKVDVSDVEKLMLSNAERLMFSKTVLQSPKAVLEEVVAIASRPDPVSYDDVSDDESDE